MEHLVSNKHIVWNKLAQDEDVLRFINTTSYDPLKPIGDNFCNDLI